jgi:hypothetical protein
MWQFHGLDKYGQNIKAVCRLRPLGDWRFNADFGLEGLQGVF